MLISMIRKNVIFKNNSLNRGLQSNTCIKASLHSGISWEDIIKILKFFKKRIFFIDLFVPFFIATYLKSLFIDIFNLDVSYYKDFILSGTIFILITYIIGFFLKKLNLSKNIRKKKYSSYIIFRYFNMTIAYLVGPILFVFIEYLFQYVNIFPQIIPSGK